MFASIPSAVLFGARGHPVTVEVHVGRGLPGFHVVGLPDESIRESRDRVRAAVMSSDAIWPDTKITVNLAPSQQRKSGSGLDLAIAVGVLVASEQVPADSVSEMAFIGELGLDGSIRGVPGVAPMAGVAMRPELVVPVANAHEAWVVCDGRVHPVAHLRELIAVLGEDRAPWPDHDICVVDIEDGPTADLADVVGQPVARKALEIAAAGGHHCLFVGPPGSGKTMLAARLPGLLPELDRNQALEVTMIHSAAGIALPATGLVTRPPYRAPHHTSSEPAIVGGGSHSLRPGEISIAHCGVLFMDELPEYHPRVIDTIRQPLEDGEVRVSRAAHHTTIPSRFQLVAAMNPCPCGEGGRPGGCDCGDARVARYAGRVSGPLLDRFDLRVRVHRPLVDDLLSGERGESTAVVAERVRVARTLATRRQGGVNAGLSPADLDAVAPLTAEALAVLRFEMDKGRLSGRGYHRIRRVARTIADLESEPPEVIGEAAITLALDMRASVGPLRAGTVAA
ncbi:YifB family Mg chelatase-like AAA ATPase [Ilumatobacter sp.]|uniref:YifB family Mg chelatase-like AAA ATPase n=1 Tax=Ilumatobacter sp. TaxID=1967498 RepID=UPI003C6B33F8